MRNVLLKLTNVVSVLIIVFSVVALLTVVLAKPGEAPNFFGFSMFRVMTGSMEPSIPTDSLIVVKRMSAKNLAEGDVITFYSRDPSLAGEPNTHRIVRFEEEDGKRIIITKGDANNIEDRYPTHEEDVIGKVIFSSIKLGKFIRLLSNPVIFIPVIIIPLILMLGRSVLDSISAAKKLAKEEEEAAVREALAELRKKREAEKLAAEGNSGGDGEKDDAENGDSKAPEVVEDPVKEGKTECVNEEQSASGKHKSEDFVVDRETIASSEASAGKNQTERKETTAEWKTKAMAASAERWRGRYDVRQKNQKRKIGSKGKWKA